jgi:hypothetical protein
MLRSRIVCVLALVLAGCGPTREGLDDPYSGGGGSGGGGGDGAGTGAGGGDAGGAVAPPITMSRSPDAGVVTTPRLDGAAADMGRAPDGAAAATDGGAAAPTFTSLYMRIFGVPMGASPSSCAGAPCHNPGTQKGVVFSTQANAYKTLVPKYVTAGNASVSKLYQDLNGGKMPQGEPKLSAALIQDVKNWINAGAKND